MTNIILIGWITWADFGLILALVVQDCIDSAGRRSAADVKEENKKVYIHMFDLDGCL